MTSEAETMRPDWLNTFRNQEWLRCTAPGFGVLRSSAFTSPDELFPLHYLFIV